jgi:uncharacterized protein YuzE
LCLKTIRLKKPGRYAKIYIDLDANGNPVSMTIEHAKETAHLPDIAYQQIDKAIA